MCDASIDWLLVAGTEKNDVNTTTLQAKITNNNFFFIITRFLPFPIKFFHIDNVFL